MSRLLTKRELLRINPSGIVDASLEVKAEKPSVTATQPAPMNVQGLPEIARFESVLYSGAAFNQWWSSIPVVTDIQGVEGRLPLPCLADHSNQCSSTIGQHENITLGNEILTTGRIFPKSDSTAAKIYNYAKQSYAWQESHAGPIKSIEEFESGEVVEVNGRSFTGPIYVIRHLVLREGTVVPVGADRDTSFKLVSED
ncbi:MAG: hypothetical protein BBJ57_02060 [Desulfobacterales bacterium PC51MH44]|nr:MAG: hypothetical protein BBJ57_02060 [Desulfobacterales bacterium PC51MH44]